jgi:hypothetical protein
VRNLCFVRDYFTSPINFASTWLVLVAFGRLSLRVQFPRGARALLRPIT